MNDNLEWKPVEAPDWKIPPMGAVQEQSTAQVQEAEIVPPAPVPPMPQTQTEFAGLPVRASGDKVFILKDGKRHWVTSPEAFAKLGFKLGDERRIDQATLAVLPEGEPIR